MYIYLFIYFDNRRGGVVIKKIVMVWRKCENELLVKKGVGF